MASITGSKTSIGLTLSSTFGTVVQAGTGHKVIVDGLTRGKGRTELAENPIGSGLAMQQDTAVGDYNPTASFSKTIKDLDQGNALFGAFWGQETVAATGTGHVHSWTFNASSTTAFANLAFTPDTTGVIESINGVVNSIEFTLNPNDFLKANYDLLFTDERITGTTNSNATLAAATEVTGRKPFIVRPQHYIRMNAQAGAALTNSDKIEVINVVARVSQPKELVGEIKGSSGYGAPRLAGAGSAQLEGSVTVTFKRLEDLTYFTAADAGTEYKMDMIVEGDLISGSTYRTFKLLYPRLIITTDPEYNVTNVGDNELTVTFKALVAASIPSGMSDVYPHPQLINSRATAYWGN